MPPKFRCTRRLPSHWFASVLGALFCLLSAACAAPSRSTDASAVSLPLQRGLYDGEVVFYVTTDVSDDKVAKAKGANFAPRLADALAGAAGPAGPRLAVDKVYAVVNFSQPSVFASAPKPIGHLNRDAAYSPLWRMVAVTWRNTYDARELRSEDDVLEAQEKGQVDLTTTNVVLNCPIIHRGKAGGLPGVSLEP